MFPFCSFMFSYVNLSAPSFFCESVISDNHVSLRFSFSDNKRFIIIIIIIVTSFVITRCQMNESFNIDLKRS
jgi:hypothetical protein